MEMTSVDNRKSTPINWACFSNSEVALIYLLGFVDYRYLSMQDIDGFTPLHTAVRASEKLKSGRPVRALLMRGADKTIQDKQGRTALDLTNDIEDKKIQAEVRLFLQTESKFDCLMLKTPLKRTEKSLKMPIAFLVFFDSIYGLALLFLFPIWQDEQRVYLTSFLGFMTIVFWFLTSFSNPGVIMKPREMDFLVSLF